MAMKSLAPIALVAGLSCAGCASTLVPLGAAVPVTDTTPRAVPLEVVTRSSLPEPLALVNGNARYADLELSLGHAVTSAVAPWAEEHRAVRPDGWQLLIELANARAERDDGVISVAINARATLRTRVGHVYLAQTQAHCLARGAAPATGGAPVFYVCMMSLGRELAGWLGGIQP
jgi:hypothetical protein